ncbi:MAG TPA: hypothetical protein VGW10_19145 [Solirubrobacteraceae bacterium]|nr:hypothetical protein [Solirubrobacteraceae bacterium]
MSAARRIALLLAVAAGALPAAPATAQAARAWSHSAATPHDAFFAHAAVTALDEVVIV